MSTGSGRAEPDRNRAAVLFICSYNPGKAAAARNFYEIIPP